MLEHLQIDRWNLAPDEAKTLIGFLEAIGFQRAYCDEAKQSALLTAPRGVFSVNMPSAAPSSEAGHHVVVGVSNPDVVFDLAQKFGLKILSDSLLPEGESRSFSLELPGEIVLFVVGGPAELPPGLEGKLEAAGKRFAIVVSRFNAFITERLLQGARDGLRQCGAARSDIQIVRVPGSFEIPSAARTLAETKKYDAVLCLGCLLRGDTAHYDVIVNEVTRGIGQSAQETGVPHAFGVLTCNTLDQAIDRAGLKMGNKGFEAALAAVEMANLRLAVSRQPSAISKSETRKPASPVRKRKTGR